MSDGVTELPDRTQAFCAALAKDTTKALFEPRETAWKTDIEAPAGPLPKIMAVKISRLADDAHKSKLFRINRGQRFSADKSPYKIRPTMVRPTAGREALTPVFSFAIGPREACVACCTSGFDKAALSRSRRMEDSWGDWLAAIIGKTGATLSDFGPKSLKRAPTPYGAEHPHDDLLRRKSLALIVPLPGDRRETGDGLAAALTDRVEVPMRFGRCMAERL